MEPATTVSYLLQHTVAILGRQSDQVLQERLGIGMSQYRILMMLQARPNIQQRKLADSLGQTEASVSRQIKLLSEKGLLAARVNPKSRREHLALPTPMGVKVTEAAHEILANYHAPLLEALTGKQREQLLEMLAAFHGRICSPGRPFACDHPFMV